MWFCFCFCFPIDELIGWNSRGILWWPSSEKFRGSWHSGLIHPENFKYVGYPSPGGQVILGRLIRFCFFDMIFLCFSVFSEIPPTSVLFSLLFLSSPLGITKRILWDGSKSQKMCHFCKMLISWILCWAMLLHRIRMWRAFLLTWRVSVVMQKVNIRVILRVSNTNLLHHMVEQS